MAEPVLMIALSPTMQEGLIASWLVAEGQAVKPGDALCEIETDKATMPYESPKAGVILKIVAAAGTKATVGQAIAVIGKAGEDWSAAAAAATPPPSQAGAAPGLAAARTVKVETGSGPKPSAGPVPPAVEPSSKAASPVGSPAPGAGTPLPSPGRRPSAPAAIPPSSPLARRLARERGIDIRSVSGSGPRGRVIARDLDGASRAAPRLGEASGGGASGGGVHRPARFRDERVPLSPMRSTIAKRLGASWSEAPHFFVRAAVDMERLLSFRASVNSGRDKPLGLNAFAMRVVAAALERHPGINASWEGDAIRYLPSADIGLAVALDGGLITPIVRACEAKGVAEIDAELTDLVARARTGKLSPDEYLGASFTISNLGSYGVEEFTAVINPPGSAILALGAIVKEAVVRDDKIEVARTMRITLSCDHRVIDGAAAAAFVAELKAMLEEPARALV